MTRVLFPLIAFALVALPASAKDLRSTVLAGGCFWCVEADFDRLEGVVETISGYAGGTVENPTYRQVVRQGTGHLESVRITYDADVIDYETILHAFLRSIDPTDAGGQFCDRGESYTTAIFVASPEERAAAEAAVSAAAETLGTEIATTIRDAAPFYPAEDYHQDFARKNPFRYHSYRIGCARDARVESLWGEAAPFIGH